MKHSRHQAREVALQILYRYDTAPAAGPRPADNPPEKLPETLIDELNHHFDHFKVPEELRPFSAELVAGTLREIVRLDGLLEKHAAHWKVGRMSAVDRNLLRLSMYELGHFPDTPVSVVIDEAVELAKQFGTADSGAFVNGVLDAVKGALRGK